MVIQPTSPDPYFDEVPRAITRSALMGLIEGLGLDPDKLYSLRVHNRGVFADVFYRNDEGARLFDNEDEGWVKHTIFIPCINDDAEVIGR